MPDPFDPARTLNAAIAAHKAGRLAEAETGYAALIDRDSGHADAHHLLGVVRAQSGVPAAAEHAIRRALRLKTTPDYLSSLGNVLKQQGRFDEAVAAFRQAIALRPDFAQAHYNLANTLKEQDRLDEAVTAFQQAIRTQPRYADAYANLGNTFQALGRLDDALAAYRQTQALVPDHAGAHFGEALVLLLTGNYPLGWEKYRWRWRQPLAEQTRHRQPAWDGAPLADQTILLSCEQGYGDSVQFIRYAEAVKSLGGTVLLDCQPPLAPLFSSLGSIDQILERGQHRMDIRADVQAPLLDLPGLLWQRVGFAPETSPYLHADPSRVACWRDWLATDPTWSTLAPKIGLAWRGSPAHSNDRNRSLNPSLLQPLVAAFPNTCFVSLQKAPHIGDRDVFALLSNMVDKTERLNDFADTAALVSQLDLVITVDTAVAHLAGALGRPTWILLPLVPDWRWLLDRSNSPWYPSVRLFRQNRRGDWTTALQAVTSALRALAT